MDMPSECPICELPFLPEPGFYLGAAYISYAVNALLLTAVGLALYHSRFGVNIGLSVIATVVIVIGLLPLTLRFSKSAWIHIVVRYRGRVGDKRTFI